MSQKNNRGEDLCCALTRVSLVTNFQCFNRTAYTSAVSLKTRVAVEHCIQRLREKKERELYGVARATNTRDSVVRSTQMIARRPRRVVIVSML